VSAVIANSRSVNRSTATVSKLKSSALKSVAARLARMENAKELNVNVHQGSLASAHIQVIYKLKALIVD
jgi:hypothetical protein